MEGKDYEINIKEKNEGWEKYLERRLRKILRKEDERNIKKGVREKY